MANAAKTTEFEEHHKIDIGMKDQQREQVIEILSDILADQHVLYMKTRKYHWNVLGPDFLQIHKLLEEQYEQLAESIDETAERIRMVGGKAIGTMEEFLGRARLQERPGEYPTARDMLHDLLHDHETAIRQLREDARTVDEEHNDLPTSDFLIELAQGHEKMAWFLGSIIADDHSLDYQPETRKRSTDGKR